MCISLIARAQYSDIANHCTFKKDEDTQGICTYDSARLWGTPYISQCNFMIHCAWK